MINFEIKEPLVKDPQEIENLSLKLILEEANNYPEFQRFNSDQQKVIQRMIHTTTCFDNIINNITFTKKATDTLKLFLREGASLLTDTNMIKAGIQKTYTEKFNNNVICYVSEPDIKATAEKEGTTRTVASVKKALGELKNTYTILACGNAPTFLYAVVETLINTHWDFSKILVLAMPVGFVNVIESKEYTYNFMKRANVEGIVLKGRYGGSPLVVSCLHSIYKLLL